MRGLVLLGLILVLAACGSSGRGKSKSTFAKEANAVCSRYQKKIDALPPPRRPSETRPLLDRTIALARQERRALARVRPPRGQRSKFRRELAGRDELLAAFANEKDAIVRYTFDVARGRSGKNALRAIAADLNPRQEKVRRLDEELGLTSCLNEFR